MPRKKNNKVLVLKILLEDKDIAEEDLARGTNDLTRILSEFRKDIVSDQKNKFDNFFFGESLEDQPDKYSNESTASLAVSEKISCHSENNKNINQPSWIKALYKKIVQRTHPDKYIDFPIQEIKEKFTRVYINAVNAYEKNDIGLLLLCAYETEIKVKESEAEKYLNESIAKYKNRISEVNTLIGYQWCHIPEINRLPFLKAYLTRLGYEFNQKTAAEAIKKSRYIKRKIGKKPEKIRVKRRKIN